MIGQFKFKGNLLIKLIAINVVLFILLGLINVAGRMLGFTTEWTHTLFSLSSDLNLVATHPWTILSYMFTQYDLLHLLFNMLWLYWFGEILLLTLGKHHLLTLYLAGGLFGGIAYEAAYNLIPTFASHSAELCGSSASVLAIMTAAAFRSPDYRLNLLLIGSIKLKWVAIASIIIAFIGIGGINLGGEIAHLGGVAFGALFGILLRRGYDITKRFSSFFSKTSSSVNKKRTVPKGSKKAVEAMEKHRSDLQRLDCLLDKIKKSGYNSLTAKEQKELEELSSRLK